MTKFLKLIWKGKFNGVEDLPIGELPKNAVRFEEPESAEELAKETRRFLIPVVIFLLIVIFLRIKINGFFGVSAKISFSYIYYSHNKEKIHIFKSFPKHSIWVFTPYNMDFYT